jgi:hypothetical protein
MNSVRRIHAAGFGQDGTGSTTSQVRFTGDCDAGGKTLRLRIRLRTTDENQRPRTVVIILAGKNAWQRSRTGKNGRWSRWKVRKGESAYLLFLLGPLLCPIGSAAGTTAQRDLGSLPVQHLGTAMVHDLPTWHLRLQSEQTGEQVTQDWYVDQRTRYWDRFVVTDVNQRNQGAQDSSITDIEYSRFNLPVKIRPPRA